jgi:hypothetical protein
MLNGVLHNIVLVFIYWIDGALMDKAECVGGMCRNANIGIKWAMKINGHVTRLQIEKHDVLDGCVMIIC